MMLNMDSPLLSRFVSEIANTVPPSQSKLYSSWSVCDAEMDTPSKPECRSAPLSLVNSGNGSDVLGLACDIQEEASKLESATDWDSLSRLFPPLWAANVSDQMELPEYFPNSLSENFNLSSVLSTQSHRDQVRKLPDMESLQKGFEDLGLLQSLVTHPGACNPHLADLLQDVYIENSGLRLDSDFQQNEASNKTTDGYIQFPCADYATNCTSIGTNYQKRINNKPFGFEKTMWKADEGREMFMRNKTLNQQNSYNSNKVWDKETNPKIYNDFATLKSGLGAKQSTYHYNKPFLKEQSVMPAVHKKPYYNGSEDYYSNFPKVGHFECPANTSIHSPKEHFAKSPECGSPNNDVHHQNSRRTPQAWLQSEQIAAQRPVSTSPQPSVNSTLSDGSPEHHSVSQSPYFPNTSPISPLEQNTYLNCSSGKMGFSNFIDENQRQSKSFEHSPPYKDRMYKNSPFGFPPNGTPQHPPNTCSNNSERYRLYKKQTLQNTSGNEKKGRNNWHPQQGNVRQPQHNLFRRKQDPNVGNVSDFINASFLPSFSMSDINQSQNNPSFNPQTFSPPANLAFPPPPFPFSDFIDLFHYEDLNRLNPFISDLFCGEIPTPYLAFPTPLNRYRPPRNRSGPANELHIQLEECCEQWRSLEKERKKAEADLARSFSGNRVSSSYNSTVPRLPANPSRVDRLIVDQSREQARAVSLVKIMERLRGSALHINISLALEQHLEAIHLTQARRKDEIVNAANRQKHGAPRYNNEKDVLALAAAIKEMATSTRKARTALWCALQITLSKSSLGTMVKREDIERALQELFPERVHSFVVDSIEDVRNQNQEEPVQDAS